MHGTDRISHSLGGYAPDSSPVEVSTCPVACGQSLLGPHWEKDRPLDTHTTYKNILKSLQFSAASSITRLEDKSVWLQETSSSQSDNTEAEQHCSVSLLWLSDSLVSTTWAVSHNPGYIKVAECQVFKGSYTGKRSHLNLFNPWTPPLVEAWGQDLQSIEKCLTCHLSAGPLLELKPTLKVK